MLHVGSWEQEFLAWMTSWQGPIWNVLAGIFTFMGTEDFFLLVIPAVFWTVSRKTGIQLFYVLMATLFVNIILKDGLGVTRPVGVEGVHSREIESAMVDSHYPNDSFPSFHAQSAAALFGFMALAVRRRWAWWIAAVLTALVALSRLYNGLHWPTDVLGGIALGALTVVVARYAAPAMESRPIAFKAAAVGVFAALMAFFLGNVGTKVSGALLGGGLGHLLEASVTELDPKRGKLPRKVLAIVIGFVGILVLRVGLKAAFPSGPVWDWLRYVLIGFWAFGLAPIMFVRAKLLQGARTSPSDSFNPPPPAPPVD